MTGLPPTRLFRDALDARANDQDEAARSALRSSYRAVRGRTAWLAQDIAHSMPSLTVHDHSHSDALWELIDLVAGNHVRLNPAEAYVLGCAVLIHDLGLGIASYPDGWAALRKEQLWTDTVSRLVRRDLGRTPDAEELRVGAALVAREADEFVLRARHAARAEELAKISWQDDDGPHYLIDDEALRDAYGTLIGRIAHSHWWPIERVGDEFARSVGATPLVPAEWQIDSLKLACLLRVADALHLDARRAPMFLRAIKDPGPEAASHWLFQRRLNRPYLEHDRVVFSSSNPFPLDEAVAWWLCQDMLNVADVWLREVDALLADLGRDRLAARSVAAVDDPTRLARLVKTEGWVPVDASIRVSNVARLVERLGGSQLYGDDHRVPLRELIQNASDATRARRVLQKRPRAWGDVVLSLRNDGDAWWLEVSDSGVGMSERVLTGQLVNFGESLWESDALTTEFPGLLSQGFSPTGQFGVGFFSAFMLGDDVEIVTRPYRAGESATRILRFDSGLQQRPVLRHPRPEEVREEGGTTVRIRLRGHRDWASYLGRWGRDFFDVCERLCPSLDVNLFVELEGERRRVVGARDWQDLSPTELRERIDGVRTGESDNSLASTDRRLRPLYDSAGELVGRAAIVPDGAGSPARPRRVEMGVVTAGGLRSVALRGVCGILEGRPARAARDLAIPVVSHEELVRWSSEQARLLADEDLDAERQLQAAQLVRLFGGDCGTLPVAETKEGYANAADVADWADGHDTIIVVSSTTLSIARREYGADFDLLDNAIAAEASCPIVLDADGSAGLLWPPVWSLWDEGQRRHRNYGELKDLVLVQVAAAWDIHPDQLADQSLIPTDAAPVKAEYGRCGDRLVSGSVTILRAVPRAAG